MNTDIRNLLEKIDEISSLPEIYTSINEAINHPMKGMADIANIISSDPGLSSRLLKLANSPFYGFPSAIDDISQALILIGTSQTRDLALATCVTTMFSSIPSNMVDMRSFWEHSIACGTAARVLATCTGEVNTERFFLAGILHDIGRIAIFNWFPEGAHKIMETAADKKQLLHTLEKETFGFDHADAGGALLSHWGLPGRITEMVEFHHNPLQTPHYVLESSFVHVADIIVHALELGQNGQRFVPPLDEQALVNTGVNPEQLHEIMQQTEQQTFDAIRALMPEPEPCQAAVG